MAQMLYMHSVEETVSDHGITKFATDKISTIHPITVGGEIPDLQLCSQQNYKTNIEIVFGVETQRSRKNRREVVACQFKLDIEVPNRFHTPALFLVTSQAIISS